MIKETFSKHLLIFNLNFWIINLNKEKKVIKMSEEAKSQAEQSEQEVENPEPPLPVKKE